MWIKQIVAARAAKKAKYNLDETKEAKRVHQNRIWVVLKLSNLYARLLKKRRAIGIRLHWPKLFDYLTFTAAMEHQA